MSWNRQWPVQGEKTRSVEQAGKLMLETGQGGGFIHSDHDLMKIMGVMMGGDVEGNLSDRTRHGALSSG